MRPSSVVAAIIFIIVAVLQAIRYFNHWPVTIDGMDVPLWVSLAGIIVPGIMAIWLLYEGGEKGTSEIPSEKQMGNKSLH